MRCPEPLCSCSLVCPLCGLCCVRGVLGPSAPVSRCARSACGVACTVSAATWLLFTGVLAGFVVLCVVCAMSWATWFLSTGVRLVCCVACMGRSCGARTRLSGRRLFVAGRGWVPYGRANGHLDGGWFVAGRGWVCCRARIRPSGRRLFPSRQGLGLLPGAHTSIQMATVLPGTCSPVSSIGALCCVSGVLGLLAHVFRCAGSARCVVCAVSGATWLLFTCVPAQCVVSRGCVACAVSSATWLLFTGVPARCVVSRVRCARPLGSCS